MIRPSFREGDSEQTDEVVICGFDGDICFYKGLPLAYQGSKFVGCEVEAVEVGEAILPLYLIYSEFDFAKGMVLVFLQIR